MPSPRCAWLLPSFVNAVCLVLLLLAPSVPDAAPLPVLRHEVLAADVDVLQRTYEQLHPGLYRYNTPAQMDAHFRVLRKALDHDQPVASAYLAVSQFAAKLRCGHSYANFYNQTEAVQHALFEGTNRVPFHFRWLDRRMIVTRDFTSGKRLPLGTEVVSINGVPVGRILGTLMTIARADGSNDAKRIAQLQVQGEDKYETFDIFLPLFFPQIGSEQRLETRAPGATRTHTIKVKALSDAQRLASRPARTDDERAGWLLDTGNPQLAVLRMPDWALYDAKWDWKAWLQASFEQLAAQPGKALVIDLRGNEGGLDVGEELLPHFIHRDLVVPDPPRRVRYRKVPDDLAPMLETWDPSFKDWGEAAQPFDDRFYTLTRYQDASGVSTIKPRAPRFAGRVFVLIGATNSSATFQFAQQIQQVRLGTLVGQPTGGNQRGINGGAFFFLRLPNSTLELDVPLIASFPPGNPPDAGITPDISVVQSVEDIATGRDAEMAAVVAALRNEGQP